MEPIDRPSSHPSQIISLAIYFYRRLIYLLSGEGIRGLVGILNGTGGD
jgi:hypothetical protein